MTPNGPSTPPPTGSPTRHALLVTCRDHALERLQEILVEALKGAADDLLDIATRTADPEVRKEYLHAVDQARALGAGFRNGVAEAYKKRVATLSGNRIAEPAAASYDAGSLTLVQTGVLENEIAIGNLSLRESISKPITDDPWMLGQVIQLNSEEGRAWVKNRPSHQQLKPG